MNFTCANAYLFKVTPVMKYQDGKKTDEIAFYRLTFRTCEVTKSSLASISYFDVVPSKELSDKYKDTWVDLTQRVYSITGRISRTYDKELQKGYTNFYLDTIADAG